MLFFAGDLVYKVKKPVDLGFLDFTSLQARRHFCREEVRLNRRLAPWVYLGVVEITRDAHGIVRIGGDGEIIDYAVQMHRLPAHRMLDRLLGQGEIDNRTLDELVSILVEFHRQAATGPGVDEFASPAELRRQVEDNLAEFEPPTAPGVARLGAPAADLRRHLRGWALRFIEANGPLLERRIAEGRIRDGHGDLHAGNICLSERGIVIYDCIEFTPRFRCRDVACELAFLAMDLDFRRYRGFAGYLLRRYAEQASDPDLLVLVDFYRAHLAAVRAKVNLIKAQSENVAATERLESMTLARRYLHLAVSYTLPPGLLLTCGLPASGKSWAARQVAAPFEAIVLRSDVIRKELAGVPPTRRMTAESCEGIYSPQMSKRTFDTLRARAREEIGRGRTVVADATFATRAGRQPFVALATELDVPLVVIEMQCPESIVRERLLARAGDEREVSDADLKVYERMKQSFEPPEEIAASQRVVCTPETSPDDLVEAVLSRLVVAGTT